MVAFDNAEDVVRWIVPEGDAVEGDVVRVLTAACRVLRSKRFRAIEIRPHTDVSSLVYTGPDAFSREPDVIRLGTRRKDLTVLWDFMHEVGHAHQDPPPPNYDPRSPENLPREEEAWDIGSRFIEEEAPSWIAYRESFDQRKAECLATRGR